MLGTFAVDQTHHHLSQQGSPLNIKEIKPVNPKGKSTLNIHWKD